MKHKKASQSSFNLQSQSYNSSFIEMDRQKSIVGPTSQDSISVQQRTVFRSASMQEEKLQTFGKGLKLGDLGVWIQNPILDPSKDKLHSKRPNTLIDPIKIKRSDLVQQNILMAFQGSPKNIIEENTQDEHQINIRCFQSKFIRELNFKDNEKFKKNKKRIPTNKTSKTSTQQISDRFRKTSRPQIKKPLKQIVYKGIRILSEFKNDLIHGQTQIYYPNGAKFIGRYEQGVRVFGQFDFNNGYQYYGGFWGDKFQGEGQLTLPSGKSFSGEWVESQLSGKVQIKYPSQDLYYGEVKEFKKHGKGYLFFKNGQKYVGEFQDGSITGKGEYFIEDECIGRGIWKNGELIYKIEDSEQFEFYDSRDLSNSKKSLTPSTASLMIKKQSVQSPSMQNKQKPSQGQEKRDFIQFSNDQMDIEEEVNIKVRSNQKMISFAQINHNTTNNPQSQSQKSEQEKKLLSYDRIVTFNQQKDSASKNKQNFVEKSTGSTKLRSLRSLKQKKWRKSEQNLIQGSQTCDDECFQTIDMVDFCNKVQRIDPNDKIFIESINRRNDILKTSQNSQSSESVMMKTGKFNSIRSFIKSQQNSDRHIKFALQ